MEDSFIRYINGSLKNGFIELEADWVKYMDRLAYMIKYFACKYPVHVVLHASRKFIDTYSFLIDLELEIGDHENVTLFLEKDIESIAYHVLMMSRFGKGIMILVIPYDRRLCSQIENIRLVSCSKILWRAVDKGWKIILVNPIVTGSSMYETIVTPYTYRVVFSGNGDTRFDLIERSSMCVVIKS